MSANSFSLHIGINGVDKNHYQGWDGKLYGCENDALFYHDIARKAGCRVSKLLLNTDRSNLPTSDNVLKFLEYSIDGLAEGDSLFITYSGHGGILEDKNFDETDFQDETWCLYDRQLLDDELFSRFKRFRPGVNIFMISDSCHSGSVSKGLHENDQLAEQIIRLAPRQELFSAYQANKQLYEPLMRQRIVREQEIPASVMLLAACQDNEYAMEANGNGLFTKSVMRILERNADINTYEELFVRVKRALTGRQNPNILCYGTNHQRLPKFKPFGFTGNSPADNLNDPFAGEASVTVEIEGCCDRLEEVTQYLFTARDNKGGTDKNAVFYCKTVAGETFQYPWDLAYHRYQVLNKLGLKLVRIAPEFEEPYEDAKCIIPVFTNFLKQKGIRSRGVGDETNDEVQADKILLQMLSLEIAQIVFRDKAFKADRAKTADEWVESLNDPDAVEEFTDLLKDSIYTSDTLIVHL
jgi:hypothetical protein